jgi:hypothetical protein
VLEIRLYEHDPRIADKPADLVEKDQRTHSGECAHSKGPCKVLTQGNPNKVSLTVREVQK